MQKLFKWVLTAVLMTALVFGTVAQADVIKLSDEDLTRVVMLNDDIDSTTYMEFLKATTGEFSTLHIIISSPGGRSHSSIDIVNCILRLKAKGVNVITESSGETASGAAFIFMAGDTRIAHDGDQIMFHTSAWTNYQGKRVPCDKMPMDYACDTVNDQNRYLRQFLLNVVKDADIVNDMLDADANWYYFGEFLSNNIATRIE